MNIIDILNIITQFNFFASVLLVLLVIRHYVYFGKGTTKPTLIKWLKRVFLGDILMGVSIALFNITPYFTSIENYHTYEILRVVLKVTQTGSILFAGWANWGLYKYLESDKVVRK